MFFIFSKLLTFLISPLIWIITALTITFFLNKKKKIGLYTTLGLLVFFSNSFIFNEFSRCWEIQGTTEKELKIYEVGIVLGGISSYDNHLQRVIFQRSADRLIQAVELYKKGIIKKIMFTGGSGSLLHPEKKEGNYIRNYLLAFNIPEKDFLIESASKNTRENALFSKKLLEQHPLIKGKVLLITSAFHMRRSIGCFKKAGFDAIYPYSTDFYAPSERIWDVDDLLVPNIYTVGSWSNLIHEVIGFITYKMIGYA